MKIRHALESDLKSLANLLLAAHEIHVKAHPEVYREISHETAVDSLLPRLGTDTYLRVAEFEMEILGYCSASIQTSPTIPIIEPRRFIYVDEVVVRPQSRKSGVGRALLDDLKAFARQEGISNVELDVGHFNSEAKAFFQAQGFQVLRERMGTLVGT